VPAMQITWLVASFNLIAISSDIGLPKFRSR
jgi:hypothetical protein